MEISYNIMVLAVDPHLLSKDSHIFVLETFMQVSIFMFVLQNSIWFGLGWGLAFFIPAIIFALLTVNLYQREEPYDTGFHRTRKMLKARDKEESTFDNP